MLVDASRAWLLAALLVPSIAGASVAHIPSTIEGIFKAVPYSKLVRISALTVRDLKYASKAENIDGLLELAVIEGRVDKVGSMMAWSRFNAIHSGDLLLLRCLQTPRCEPVPFSSIARASDLHAQVLLRRPDLSLTQVNHAVGDISERVMNAHFENSGWTRIEGQVGRTGIDGLFIKLKTDGVVRDVLLVESKYNTATLSPSNYGQQLSRDWALRKLEELQRKYPNELAYKQIDSLIRQGYYRARLWTMRFDGDQIQLDLQRVHSKGSDIELLDDPGNRIAPPPKVIRIAAPANEFEITIIRAYNEALDRIGSPPH